MKGNMATIEGEVPLAETFGYSTDLRSMTQGQGTFTMEFSKYRRVPNSIQQEIILERKKSQLVGAKQLACRLWANIKTKAAMPANPADGISCARS
jgi:hypothetical protein